MLSKVLHVHCESGYEHLSITDSFILFIGVKSVLKATLSPIHWNQH